MRNDSETNTGQPGKPTLFHQHHCYAPHAGLETLWFYREFRADGPEPEEDPNAIRILGPASSGECASVVKSIRIVLAELGLEVIEEHGADD
jgi:hypothetical protein